MGNHAVGKAMGLMADQLIMRRLPGESALRLLDVICEPYRGYDAEFEAEDPLKPGNIHPAYANYTSPLGPLGALIAEAFAPNGIADIPRFAGDPEAWYEEVEHKFSERYGFC